MLKKLFNREQSDMPVIDSNVIPKHVAIIMDGNGRWAKRRGMPRSMGHRAGADVLKQIVMTADEIGIRALTVYGFSTENWKRPEQEVSLLMALIKEYLNNNVKYMHEHNVRIRFIGFIGALSEELQEIIRDAELLTKNNTGLTLQFLLWQLAYAEFWFTDLHWPDFTKKTLLEAVAAYQKRERRFGGLSDEE